MQCPYCKKEHGEGVKYCPSTGNQIGYKTTQNRTKKISILNIIILAIGLGFIIFSVLLSSKKITPFSPINHNGAQLGSVNEIIESNQEVLSTSPVQNEAIISEAPKLNQIPVTDSVKVNIFDQAEIVLIPEGYFNMGSDPSSDPYFWGAEAPLHNVYLDSYLIYRYEVTNGMYELCVSAGYCPAPQYARSRTRESYFGNPEFQNYPVIYVSYSDASTYCKWVGGRLPTEAEWEKSARGDEDARLFPWGNFPAEGNNANFCDNGCPSPLLVDFDKEDGYNDTAPIGSYEEGKSLYGVYDTSGNVWEWVFDYFSPSYYQTSPDKNPYGPDSSDKRVIRGGGWSNPSTGVRIVQRSSLRPDQSLDTLGFRCVIDME